MPKLIKPISPSLLSFPNAYSLNLPSNEVDVSKELETISIPLFIEFKPILSQEKFYIKEK